MKLWGVCDEIILWEEKMKAKMGRENGKENEKKNENGEENEIMAKENGEKIAKKILETATVKNTENCDNQSNVKNTGNGKDNEEDDNFRFFWPFSLIQDEIDSATNYLSAINNSHIITQLIANYKILMLANERGLHIGDQHLMTEIGNIVVPTISPENDGFEFDEKKGNFSHCVSTVMERTDENGEYESDSEDEQIYTKKTNKRRTANNKRRKQNKKNRNENRENRRETRNNMTDDRDETEGRKITFGTDNILTDSMNNNENSEIEICNNEIRNNTCEYGFADDDNALKNTENDDIKNKAHSLEDRNENENDVKYSTSANSGKNRVLPALRIRDLALLDEKKKTIRVHEYYKNWKIYDLDVVY